MTNQGKRLIVEPDGQVTIEAFDVPVPSPEQILVRITTTQVSAGSEMNGIRRRRSASTAEQAAFPRQGMGYTAIGTVEAVGSAVQGFSPGERVFCNGNHCTHWLVTPAAVAESITSASFAIQKLPDNLSDTEAAFCVLGDIALHGVRLAQLQIGESVAVHGLGVIGQLSVQLARLAGAYPVIGVDLFAERLEQALALGATHTIDASREDVVARLRALTELPWRYRGYLPNLPPNAGAAAQLHCTSNISNYPDMIKAAADRGRIILVGATSGTAPIESNELFRREITLRGSYQTGMEEPHPYWPWTRERNRYTILDLIARGELQVKPLISHVVPYSEAPALYDLMMNGGQGWMGIFFTWQAE